MRDMARHLRTVHLPLYIGAASVLVSTSLARYVTCDTARMAVQHCCLSSLGRCYLSAQRPVMLTRIFTWTLQLLETAGENRREPHAVALS